MSSFAEAAHHCSGPSQEPTRTCIGCRAKTAQSSLLRFRLDGARVVPVVGARALEGRSAYLCPRRPCFERAIGRRAFTRAFSSRSRSRAVAAPDRAALDALWSASADSLRREIDLLERSAHDPHAHRRRRSIEGLLFELSSQPPPSDRRRNEDGQGGDPTHG